MLATAYEDGKLSRNPAADVRVVVPGERQRKPKRMTTDQTRALLAAIPAEHADLAFVMAATGLRISEALGLTWGDFGHDDTGRPVLTVRRSKTAAGVRAVPMSPATVRRLTARRSEGAHGGDDAPMFPSAFGTHMDPHNWRRRVFKPAAADAGVAWATPHSLRHGMASLMAERGYSPAQIAAHLGHADGGVLALRVYVHADAIDTPAFVDEAFGT
jgi:integrase